MMIQMIIGNIYDMFILMRLIFSIEGLDLFGACLRMQSLHFYMLSLIEICLLKFWLKFGRKRMISMDETFIVWSLTLINCFMSVLLSISKMMLGDLVGSSSEVVEKR